MLSPEVLQSRLKMGARGKVVSSVHSRTSIWVLWSPLRGTGGNSLKIGEIQGSDQRKGPQKPSLSILENGCPFYFFFLHFCSLRFPSSMADEEVRRLLYYEPICGSGLL